MHPRLDRVLLSLEVLVQTRMELGLLLELEAQCSLLGCPLATIKVHTRV